MRPRSAAAGTGAATALVAIGGALLAAQARVNGGLEQHVGVWRTAVVSFGVGWVLLLVAVLGSPRRRRGLRRLRAADTRPWEFLGGLAGAALVASSAVAAPVVGVALVQAFLVAGQTVGGLGLDRAGLGPTGRHALTWPRLGGAALAIVAVAVAGIGRQGQAAAALLALLAVVGVAASAQQAVNGRLARAAGDPVVAALVSFSVGLAALVLALGAVAGLGALGPAAWPHDPLAYVGGACGTFVVVVIAAAVQRIGVLRTGLAAVCGQLAGGLVLDTVAPVAGEALAPLTVVGTGLTFAAVALASWQGRSAARRTVES